MVAILEAEHGAAIGFATGDVDALLDVRAVTGITLEGASRLLDAGFEPDSGGARGHRFVRGDDRRVARVQDGAAALAFIIAP